MTQIPMSVHSTPALPSQVTALTTLTRAGCGATRLLRCAAAPWSADSTGAQRSRTATSSTANTSAASVTSTSGVSRARCW